MRMRLAAKREDRLAAEIVALEMKTKSQSPASSADLIAEKPHSEDVREIDDQQVYHQRSHFGSADETHKLSQMPLSPPAAPRMTTQVPLPQSGPVARAADAAAELHPHEIPEDQMFTRNMPLFETAISALKGLAGFMPRGRGATSKHLLQQQQKGERLERGARRRP